MNYKELVKRILLLISSPAKAWEEISVEEDRRQVFTAFVYPMIALCGLSYFLGSLFGNEITPVAFQKALTDCCAIFVSLFGGYFLASYLINKIGHERFDLPDDLNLIHQFAGYALVITFVANLLVGIFPTLFILGIISQFYLLYLVWEGSRILIKIEEKKQMSYTIMVSLLLLMCPFLLKVIFNKIMILLN